MSTPMTRLTTAQQDALIGTSIGNYLVRGKLGEGGMGMVYLAEHPMIGKRVAVKVLHAEFSQNREVIKRFFGEAKAVNDIRHPNIIDIIDYGVLPQNGRDTVYFVMEYIEGINLSSMLRERPPLVAGRAFAIASQVANALSASHAAGIVHRDLKPDNIMICARRGAGDIVKVLDFGIAKLTHDKPVSGQTRAGVVMGTPTYMSPEQAQGKGDVDHRTDVYALGIVLYQMLTKCVPFQGEGYGEILLQHINQPPTPLSEQLPGISPYVEAVCLKALEKAPSHRYPNMDEFARALVDPVGYIETRGGLDSFRQSAPYMPSVPEPARDVEVFSDAHYTQSTHLTTMSGAGGEVVNSHTTRSRAASGMIVIVLVAALVAGGLFALRATNVGSGEHRLMAVQPIAHVEDTSDAGVVTPPDAAGLTLVDVPIASKPAGASVYIDGEYRGKTPLTLSLPAIADSVSVTLKRAGYYSRTVAVVPSKKKQATWRLKRAKRAASRCRALKKNGLLPLGATGCD